MESERILYLVAATATGWAVTYALRALPFMLLPGKSRELPAWAHRTGRFISPVIIAALIIYSFASLEWRSCAPYLAGALTLALQLKWRNALVSITAGTALYMTLLRVALAS